MIKCFKTGNGQGPVVQRVEEEEEEEDLLNNLVGIFMQFLKKKMVALSGDIEQKQCLIKLPSQKQNKFPFLCGVSNRCFSNNLSHE